MDVTSWHMVPEILGRIKAPTFRNEDFVITSYGAVADGETDNTEAFKNAIETCNAAGGGRVVVPAVSECPMRSKRIDVCLYNANQQNPKQNCFLRVPF